MASSQRLAIAAWRNELFTLTIAVRGVDLTAAASAGTIRAQFRLLPDTPGAPRVDLATVTTTAAEGIKLDSVMMVDGLPVSTLIMRINKTTMTSAEAFPYTGEIGENSKLAFAIQWDGRTRLYGDFWALASAMDSDAAPVDRGSGYGTSPAISPVSSALVTVSNGDVISVSIDGADLLGPLTVRSESAAADAEAARDIALAAAIGRDAPLLPISTGKRILYVPQGLLDEDGYTPFAVGEDGPIGALIEAATDPLIAVATGVNDIATIAHISGQGQSLSIGQSGVPPISTTALNPGRGLMFTGSVVPGENSTAYALEDRHVSSIIDLAGPSSIGTEVHLVQAVNRMLGAVDPYTAVIASAHGVGGQLYSALKKGTQPYRNALFAMRRAAAISRGAGLDYRMIALDVVHGENNYADSLATYLGHLTEWQGDWQADARQVMGDSTAIVPLVTDQVSSWTIYGGIPTSAVTLAQLQASIDDPVRFVCVCPKYMLPYADGPHLTAAGYRLLGDYHGRALGVIATGGTWTPLRMVSAVRSATALMITCNPPAGALAIDTTRVAAAAQYGLVYKDGTGANVAISSIAVSGNTITATLASAVAGTLSAGMYGAGGDEAGPTSGPRTNFRDSSADLAADGSTPLYNWMSHCALPVA